MSWYTFTDFAYTETEELDVERVRSDIESIVKANGYHRDVAKDMCDLLSKKQADFKLNSFAVIELFSKLSEKFPLVPFAVRGRGEDIRDIWVRVYSEGKESFALGPPEDVI
jgi:hypothetical protein